MLKHTTLILKNLSSAEVINRYLPIYYRSRNVNASQNASENFPSSFCTSTALQTMHGTLPNCDSETKGPLSGMKILDMSRVLAGPFSSMLLADLGASVIKVERPGVGDETRTWGPPFVGSPGNKQSCYFIGVNRNKASVSINIKHPTGRDIVRDLSQKCDVLLENFVPGVLSRLGLGYEDLKHDAPRLIYCSLTGYGSSGPYSKRPGYDVTASSVGGLIGVTGPQDGPPCKVGVALVDLAAGLYAHGAIMAAIIERYKTGRGQRIECDLLATQVACMTNLASNYLNAGVEAKRYGTAHASIVPYQAFQTRDGSYITIAGNNNAQFAALCDRLDLQQLVTDQRYTNNGDRVTNRVQLISELSERFAEKDSKDWLERFEGCAFPYARINSLSQAFSDPQVVHKDMVKTVHHPVTGDVKVVGPAVQFSESENKVRGPPPLLGEHTRTVLTELLSYSHAQVTEFEQQGIIQCAPQ
uniref:Succinate--hydroxymethylglutarate CoA-transferase-like n=3 Tax=Hirondellea gigas TaxID=1518452 RepID=A0A6A7FWV8_9CRUS